MSCFLIRKRASIAAGISSALCFFCLVACSLLRVDDIPAKGKVTLKINANFTREELSVVTRAYVYPPLKINEKGVPQEKLFYTSDENENLQWHSPSAEADACQAVIESKLVERGFRIVPFKEILDPQNEYKILVFSPYYTPVLSKDESKQAQVIYTRLIGFILPKDLDLAKKKDWISQEVMARFNLSDDFAAAVKTSFQQSVENIGENGQWLETFPLLK